MLFTQMITQRELRRNESVALSVVDVEKHLSYVWLDGVMEYHARIIPVFYLVYT